MLDSLNLSDVELVAATSTETEIDIDSVTLERLIEEVRIAAVEPTAYNRMHNRHNRT